MGRARSGFTLVELLVTLAILGLLAMLIVPVTEVTVQRAREQELRRALREIRTAIDAYKRAYDEGRIPREGSTTGYPRDLDVLVQGVTDQRNPKRVKIYFLRRVPREPFNRDPALPASRTWGKRSYASEPDEPQEGDDVYDVYPLTDKVGLNGIPYRQW